MTAGILKIYIYKKRKKKKRKEKMGASAL